jgi:hypothetical protein
MAEIFGKVVSTCVPCGWASRLCDSKTEALSHLAGHEMNYEHVRKIYIKDHTPA